MKTAKEKNMAVAKAFIMFLKANNAFIGYMRAIRNRRDSHSTFVYFFQNFSED